MTFTSAMCNHYGEFGNLLANYGSVDNHYLYTGQEYEGSITGLYNLRARYYAAEIGRFVSEDPLNRVSEGTIAMNPHELNIYVYVQNNPINRVDPLGLKVLKECDLADIVTEMALITTVFHECCTWTWPWQIDCVKKTMQIIACMQPKLEGKLGCCDYGWGFIPVPYHWGVIVNCKDCQGYKYDKLFESWFCYEIY